jgi:hypothetical protein
MGTMVMVERAPTPAQLRERMYGAAVAVSEQARLVLRALGVRRPGDSPQAFDLEDALAVLVETLDREDEARTAYLVGPGS